MPWTESRSREEWLAEVQRRGTRIRRRRRAGMGVVAALALILPVTVMAGVLRSGPERAVELSVAGPGQAGGGDSPTTTFLIEPVGGGTGVAAATAGEPTPPAGAPSTTTTTEVHQRVAVVNGSAVEPAPPASVPPADAPVVERTTTTVAPKGNGVAAGPGDDTSPPQSPPPSTAVPPTATALPACSETDVKVTIKTEKSTYAPGDWVSGSSTVQNRSLVTCRLQLFTTFQVLNAAGNDVFGSSTGFRYSGDPRYCCSSEPIEAAPGATFTATFDWESRNSECSPPPGPIVGSVVCGAPFPPGTYTAVGLWVDLGSARTAFQISA